MTRRLNLIGRRFGQLEVLTFAGTDKHRRAQWECRCDCDTIKIISAQHLTTGATTSCGCVLGWTTKKPKHGLATRRTKHPLYRLWQSMIKRCTSPKCRSWPAYGGRGIAVCDAWKDAEIFVRWAATNGWSRGKQLHRKNNDGNYEPANCEWLAKEDHAQQHGCLPKVIRTAGVSNGCLAFGS